MTPKKAWGVGYIARTGRLFLRVFADPRVLHFCGSLMLVPCLQCRSPVFVSSQAVAAGDVRAACAACGSALIIEKGGVVRMAQPPPGPEPAPQLIVPPMLEPPMHAQAMGEYAIVDETMSALADDRVLTGSFYVAQSPPRELSEVDAFVAEQVRRYVNEAAGKRQSARAPLIQQQVSQVEDLPTRSPAPRVVPHVHEPEPVEAVGIVAASPQLDPLQQTDSGPISLPIKVPRFAPPPARHFEASAEEKNERLHIESWKEPERQDPFEIPGVSDAPPVNPNPPALMFNAHAVHRMTGPARETSAPPPTPLPQAPVLLTEPSHNPVSLVEGIPEWTAKVSRTSRAQCLRLLWRTTTHSRATSPPRHRCLATSWPRRRRLNPMPRLSTHRHRTTRSGAGAVRRCCCRVRGAALGGRGCLAVFRPRRLRGCAADESPYAAPAEGYAQQSDESYASPYPNAGVSADAYAAPPDNSYFEQSAPAPMPSAAAYIAADALPPLPPPAPEAYDPASDPYAQNDVYASPPEAPASMPPLPAPNAFGVPAAQPPAYFEPTQIDHSQHIAVNDDDDDIAHSAETLAVGNSGLCAFGDRLWRLRGEP